MQGSAGSSWPGVPERFYQALRCSSYVRCRKNESDELQRDSTRPSDYIVADGIYLPSKRRAYTRGPDRRPITEMLMVSIDFSEVRFKSALGHRMVAG